MFTVDHWRRTGWRNYLAERVLEEVRQNISDGSEQRRTMHYEEY